MFCKNCGAQIPDQTPFCQVCGAPQQTPANPRPTPRNTEPEKGTSTVIIVAIIIAAAVVTMCAMGIVAMMVLTPRLSSENDNIGVATMGIDPTVQATEAAIITEATEPANPLSLTNPYRDLYDPAGTTVLPESSERYYVRSELEQYSADTLCLARNEIFARYGYSFSDEHLAEFFRNMPWYAEDASVNSGINGKFNKYEKANIALLKYCQDRKEGQKGTPSGSIYLKYYDPDTEYILPTSNQVLLEGYHIQGMEKDQLCAARNEIFARHGYTFSDKDLFIYFSYCSWYVPTVESGRTDLLGMSTTERKNVEFIQSYEKGRVDLNNLDRTLNYTVKNNYFSVTLPAYWKTTATITKDTDYMRFNEKLSAQTDYGGHVFSLSVIKPSDFYSGGPDYLLVGTLTSGTDLLYVVSWGPTDVQYDYTDAYIDGVYNAMYEEKTRILSTIKGANGYTFTPA